MVGMHTTTIRLHSTIMTELHTTIIGLHSTIMGMFPITGLIIVVSLLIKIGHIHLWMKSIVNRFYK